MVGIAGGENDRQWRGQQGGGQGELGEQQGKLKCVEDYGAQAGTIGDMRQGVRPVCTETADAWVWHECFDGWAVPRLGHRVLAQEFKPLPARPGQQTKNLGAWCDPAVPKPGLTLAGAASSWRTPALELGDGRRARHWPHSVPPALPGLADLCLYLCLAGSHPQLWVH